MPSGSEPSLIVRADATGGVGLGHVMRSFALAEPWRDAGSMVTFAGAFEPATSSLLASAGFAVAPIEASHPDVRDRERLLALVRAEPVAWVVFDGYHFDAAYERAMRSAGARVIAMDDEDKREEYGADIIVNQNLHALQLPYAAATGAIVLTGPKYALVRGQFRARGNRRLRSGAVGRLIVLTGGADLAGLSRLALEAIRAFPARTFDVTMVVGPSNVNAGALRESAAALDIDLVVNPPDLARRMSEADLAVAASGSTTWELAYLGVPTIHLSAAQNQVPLGVAIAEYGAGAYLGGAREVTREALSAAMQSLIADPDGRERMSSAALALIDGEGASRLRRIARALDSNGDDADLRPIRAEDSRALWRMANDRDVREASFTIQPIPFAAHEKWFAERLAAAGERFWVAEIEGAILGHVRYALTAAGAAEVHFTVAAPARGRGLAARLLERTAGLVGPQLGASRLTGVALAGNTGSHRTFEKAGYRRAAVEFIQGRQCVRFEKNL